MMMRQGELWDTWLDALFAGSCLTLICWVNITVKSSLTSLTCDFIYSPNV